MPCVPCQKEAARPSSMSSSWRRCGQLSCVVRPNMDLAPSYGHSSVWAPSSNACMACVSARHRSGESWDRWASVRRNLRNGPSNATKTLCAVGNAAPGPALKKSPARRPSDRLCRRVRHQRAPNPSAHVGAQGADTHHSVSFQLDSRLGHRWTHAHQLSVPSARGQHQEGGDRRVPQGAEGSLEATTAGDLGWIEGSSQSLGTRVPGQFAWAHSNRLPAAVRAGHESGRVPVGLAQAPCAGQLLPQQSERTAHDRAQQTQERSKAPLDHRRLLDAGYLVVMS